MAARGEAGGRTRSANPVSMPATTKNEPVMMFVLI
jgi:hypothetical protein